MKKLNEQKLQKLANSIARQFGYGRATKVLFGNVKEPKIIDRVAPGYRKNTTGQYVPKKYLMNFGWKNTYYCHAVLVVMLPLELIDWNS